MVLHDLVLHHLVAGLTLARGNSGAYIAAMERDGGRRLGASPRPSPAAEPVRRGRPRERYPLAGEILDHATGLIVHSRYTDRGVREEGYRGRIWRIPLAAAPVPDVPAAQIDGSPLIGSFGHVNPAKRIPQLLRAFAQLRTHHPDARLVLAGAIAPGFELERRIEGLGLQDAVVTAGYVDDRTLWSLMASCDVIVSLRAPTMGETSRRGAAGAGSGQAPRRERARLVRRASHRPLRGTSRSAARRSTPSPLHWRS